MKNNLLRSIKEGNLGDFKWQNEATFVKPDEDTLVIKAPGKTDYFVDPAGKHVISNAPLLYQDIEGNFRLKAHVSHAFLSQWDAAVLMIWDTEEKWAKLCFEKTDFNTQAVVSVVTNGISDDANGTNYLWDNVWLQIVRQGNLFAFHYGPDGENWHMVRFFKLDVPDTIKVGMEAQCPAGDSADITFKFLSIDREPVDDLRAGI